MKLTLIIAISLFSTGLMAQGQITCPQTLAASFATPEGWKIRKDTLELSFIGSSHIGPEFACYYGVGRVALIKSIKAQNCHLKTSHKNPIGMPAGKVCNGMAQDCALICP